MRFDEGPPRAAVGGFPYPHCNMAYVMRQEHLDRLNAIKKK